MTNLERIIKRFRKDTEYTVFFENGKTVYNIILPELKQIVFADEAKRGVNVAEANCIVEVNDEGDERKTLVVSGGKLNITPPNFSSSSENYDYSSRLDYLPEPQLLFKPFLDNVRIPTYDESGRLLTDPQEIQAEVEKRRRGERKGDYWKEEWKQISFGGRLEGGSSSSRIEEINTENVPLIRDRQDRSEVEKIKKEIEDNYKKSLANAEKYKKQLEEWEKQKAETTSKQEYYKPPYFKK